MEQRTFPLRMVAWELTRNCNLNCIHCRASASLGPHTNELTTDECKNVLDGIAAFAVPTIIITGGEPLMRDDVFEIIEYGTKKGLRLVIAINGTLLTRVKAERLKTSGIKRVSLSLDGIEPATHDRFRGVEGSFKAVMHAAEILRATGLSFQINTTITRLNADIIEAMYALVRSIGAVAWHIFLLVPVGRGEGLKGVELDAAMYEEKLHHLCEMEQRNEIEMKVTCAPHYYRIQKERGITPKSGGCLAGKSFLFISHRGIAQPCGYLDIPSGDIRTAGVQKVWLESDVFNSLRNLSSYKGKCGRCRFLAICGGCRARAYEQTGNILESEPLCSYTFPPA
ncbi:MAG TPA: radical SAM protein [Syntrophorhabdaceae bacterium]|nr:radical SAM protein [Syntrophorhabdaceae bacterium]